jgi:hypothetical protein
LCSFAEIQAVFKKTAQAITLLLMTQMKKVFFLIVNASVRTDLGDLSSGGRFHERAAQYLQGVGPNVILRFNNGLSVS